MNWEYREITDPAAGGPSKACRSEWPDSALLHVARGKYTIHIGCLLAAGGTNELRN
jgi:hypothetical protein